MSLMRYVVCDDITTSVLGFGCGSVMGRVGRGASLRALSSAWDAGITLFDTARSYGYGEAESLLGEFLQGKRAQAVVVTKFGVVPAVPARWKRWAKPVVRGALRLAPGLRRRVRQGVAGEASAGHFDPASLRHSLHQSLRELRTDYVDVLLAHEAPVSAMQRDDLLAELAAVVREGKVRRAGVSAAAADVAAYASWRPATLEPAVREPAAAGPGVREAAAAGPGAGEPGAVGSTLVGPAVLRSDVLSVLQYPAQGWPRTASQWANTALRLANHPLGGAGRAAQTGKALQTLARDPRLTPELRDKLQGDIHALVAEFWFGRAIRDSHPHAIVTSMLQPAHLRADLAAIDCLRFSSDDLLALEEWLTTAVTTAG